MTNTPSVTCMDCEKPGRPIHPESGPRSPRCATHRRAWIKAGKQRASDQRSRKRSGLDEATRQEVLAEQSGLCPCGRGPGKRFNLTAEHDHDLAREHDHPEDVACPDCLTGYTCHSCNRHIIGFLTNNHGRANVSRVLRALADFLDDPPAQRVQARHFYLQQEDERESAAMWHVHGLVS